MYKDKKCYVLLVKHYWGHGSNFLCFMESSQVAKVLSVIGYPFWTYFFVNQGRLLSQQRVYVKN